MIEIDGEYGSGGGQILRTAIGLAALTTTPCRIFNIRAKRRNPGLQEQHLQALHALAQLSRAELTGAEKGSREISFSPQPIRDTDLNISISTAGSIGLVLQALLIATLRSSLSITITGGATYGKWAPPASYLQHVLLPLLAHHGYNVTLDILREGFYPKGGASVRVTLRPAQLHSFNLTSQGELQQLHILSIASTMLERARVAERQADAALQILKTHFTLQPRAHISYTSTLCPGSGILCWIETQHSRLAASAIGERGLPAERVGQQAARDLISEYKNGVVDSHAADQLLPYIALATGSLTTSTITDHCRTNCYVIEHFLPTRFHITGTTISTSPAH
jgi:RNA 3'-phosphate cyclase